MEHRTFRMPRVYSVTISALLLAVTACGADESQSADGADAPVVLGPTDPAAPADTTNPADDTAPSSEEEAAALLDGAYPALPSPSIATTGLHYYVSPNGSDANTGLDSQHAWKTLQHAAKSVKTGSSGVTVHVASGNYSGAVTVALAGASFTAPVRFISDVRWGAKLDAGGAETAWNMNGAYQELIGFDIQNAARFGVLYKASHVRVLANRVHDLAANACGPQGGAAIDTSSYSATDSEVDNNVIFAIGPMSGNQLCNSVQGIYFATPYNKAYNNLCSNVSGNCITSWHGASHLTIVNNTVMNSRSSGIVIGCGDSGCVLNDHAYVANNISVNNGAYGIQEGGNTGTNNRYVNNLVYGNVYFGKPVDILLKNGLVAQGTVKSNPLFVNDTGSVTTGDYHLQSGSPAVDKGALASTPAFDFDGFARKYGTNVDIGAFERHP